MNPRRSHHKWSGLLLLLFTVLIFQAATGATGEPAAGKRLLGEGVFIQVEGDVERPGVYAFRNPPRLEDLLARAGGISSGKPFPPLCPPVSFPSGRVVCVHAGERGVECTQREMTAFHKVTLGIPLSLNNESEEGLTALPGIGRGLAKMIVAVRSRRGGFKDMDEILLVKGIGRNLYVKVRPYLSL